jgi:acyl-coenzyme A synthetase/AMP-(fatty) acid ligase
MAKRKPNGRIQFIGRDDNQCKIRGFRVELGAVINYILEHPAVTKAEAFVQNNVLYAYISPQVDDEILQSIKANLQLAH